MSYRFTLEEIRTELDRLGVEGGLPEQQLFHIKRYLEEDDECTRLSSLSNCSSPSINCPAPPEHFSPISPIDSTCEESTDSEQIRGCDGGNHYFRKPIDSSKTPVNCDPINYKQLSRDEGKLVTRTRSEYPDRPCSSSSSSITFLPHYPNTSHGQRCEHHSQRQSASVNRFHGGEDVNTATVTNTTDHTTNNKRVRSRSARFAENPVDKVHHLRPTTAACEVYTNRRNSIPFVRCLRRQDPVSRYHSYQRSWVTQPTPVENDRRNLRWNVRNAMMHRDVPLLRRNLSEVTELFGLNAAAFLNYQRQRNLSLLQPSHLLPTHLKTRSKSQSSFNTELYRVRTA